MCLLRLSLSGCKVTCKTTGIGTLVGFKHGQTKVQPRQELITCGEIIRIEVVLKGPSPYPCCHSLRMGMNDTIKAKKYLYSYGNITIEEYVGQAILGYANLMLKN